MAAASILDFYNFEFLTVRWLKRVKQRLRAKYGGNWSNRCRDMSIFLFFQEGQSAILNLLCVCSDHPWSGFDGLYYCAKFGYNRCSSFDNMYVFWLCEFGLKTLIHASKIGVLTPKWGLGSHINETQKGMCIMGKSTSFEPSCTKIHLSCRWVP